MRRTIKKDLNLNKLKTGCSPCLNEAKKMQQKIAKRNLSEIKIKKLKILYLQYLKKNKYLTFISTRFKPL